ncbi:MAG TPA: ATP-dependent sacrificial sulfur transferase LarE [Armatimonadota bacterium]|nr:ATP-dependent sacrificial sulfur transferase LarE [Armatimonadota bacterium]
MTDIILPKQQHMEKLQEILRGMQRVIIAYSGGVDSVFLLRVAVDTLGPEQVLAVIGESPRYPSREGAEAIRLAEAMHAAYRVIHTEEMNDTRYAANPNNRCYYCKHELFSRIIRIAKDEGYAAVLDGNNADDIGDWRPGQQAARELGVRSPLIEAGFSKGIIRELSHAMGLPTWNKPASACLASRIPYGTPITSEALVAIELAENVLRDLGFRQVRVRHHDVLARIEVAPEEIFRFSNEPLRHAINEKFRAIGYQYVALDLQGYRTGSFNELLPARSTD